jgi:transposase InsO family protein
MRGEIRLDRCARQGIRAVREVRALEVSLSGYRAWKRGGTEDCRRLTDRQRLALIRALPAELKGAYGSPRRVRELRARGFPASQERGERRMRAHGLRARHQRRDKVTTDSKHGVDGRRLAVSGHRSRLVQPRGRGLVPEATHDP